MEVYGLANYTFSRGNMVWNGKDFMNQQKGKYVARQPFGHVYGRHKEWIKVNNPLNFKVDRSKKSESKANLSPTEQSEITKLQEELARTRKERDRLLSAANERNIEESKNYSKEGQFIDTYDALKKYLPSKVFEDVRQIFYGIKTDEITLNSKTIERANNSDV